MRQERVQAALAPRFVVWSLVLGVMGLSAVRAAAIGDNPPPALGASLALELTAATDLSASAHASLVAEVNAIWRRAGVRLEWRTATGQLPVPDSALRVLVMMRAAAVDDDDAWPVGELLPDQSGDSIAIASIHGARRVLAAAGYLNDTTTRRDHRLGVILGRAVAHEIGHYLLRTSGHARSGLMRTGVDARDFADLRDGRFFLDKEAALWVRQTLAVPSLTAERQSARYVY